ncbi:MAG: ABC transporter ATP-binding protein [Armatimonadota bacterium]
MADLSIRDLEVGRTDVLIEPFSLDLRSGEIFVLLGPNGSGKSTFLQTVCGMIRPRTGRVEIDQTDVTTLPLSQRCQKIAWVPQEEFVEFGWTAKEFTALGRAALSDSVFESKFDVDVTMRALAVCDAAHLADRPLLELSGGEKQRVRIARAIAQDADILVLDEPASQLDVAHVLSVLELVVNLAETGKTILLTVHDVNQGLRLPAKWGFINEKRLEVFESLGEIHASNVLKRTYDTDFRVIDSETVVAVTSLCRTTD